jgi:hypothetical protein
VLERSDPRELAAVGFAFTLALGGTMIVIPPTAGLRGIFPFLSLLVGASLYNLVAGVSLRHPFRPTAGTYQALYWCILGVYFVVAVSSLIWHVPLGLQLAASGIAIAGKAGCFALARLRYRQSLQ